MGTLDGDSEAGLLEHLQVVEPVAHCHDVRGVHAQSRHDQAHPDGLVHAHQVELAGCGAQVRDGARQRRHLGADQPCQLRDEGRGLDAGDLPEGGVGEVVGHAQVVEEVEGPRSVGVSRAKMRLQVAGHALVDTRGTPQTLRRLQKEGHVVLEEHLDGAGGHGRREPDVGEHPAVHLDVGAGSTDEPVEPGLQDPVRHHRLRPTSAQEHQVPGGPGLAHRRRMGLRDVAVVGVGAVDVEEHGPAARGTGVRCHGADCTGEAGGRLQRVSTPPRP